MLLRRSLLVRLPLRVGAASRRKCSSSSSSTPPPPVTAADAASAVDCMRVLSTGATIGAVLCMTAKVVRDTNDPKCVDMYYSKGGDYFICAVGGAIGGFVVTLVAALSLPLGGVLASILAVDWVDGFPALVHGVHGLRHGTAAAAAAAPRDEQ